MALSHRGPCVGRDPSARRLTPDRRSRRVPDVAKKKHPKGPGKGSRPNLPGQRTTRPSGGHKSGQRPAYRIDGIRELRTPIWSNDRLPEMLWPFS